MNDTPGLKIWSTLGLSAIRHRHPGAWRVWEIARHIDQAGSGKVKRTELNQYLNGLGVEPRTRRRWIADALTTGLFEPGRVNIYITGLYRVAQILYVTKIGKPAKINVQALVHKGWRAVVFEAFCATLTGPMSQRTKQELIRITPRTQRNYISKGLGYSRKNYAIRSESADHAQGLRDVRGLAVFVNRKGELIQRSPDLRIVPSSVAVPAPRGRARKVQKQLNALCYLARGNVHDCFKLFCESEKSTRQALREIERSDFTDRPREVFQFIQAGDTWNIWKVVNVPAI
jgi:hypothetical protein